MGSADLIAPMLHKVRESYNVDAIAQHLGRAGFDDLARAQESWALVREERGRLAEALSALGIETLPSQGNFLLAHIPPALGGAKALHTALADQNVHVRWLDFPCLTDWLRISIGTTRENDRLLMAIEITVGTDGRRAS